MPSVEHTAHIRDDDGLMVPVIAPSLAPKLHIESIDSIRSLPYFEKEHWLALDSVEAAYRVVALALQSFGPTRELYAFDDYFSSFNVDEVVSIAKTYAHRLKVPLAPTRVYVIAFRLRLKEEVQHLASKRQFLAKVDKDLHREANESGGLLKYWFGTPDDVHATNVATCWWRNEADALKGGRGEAHRLGVATVRGWYRKWAVEEYVLKLGEGWDYEFRRLEGRFK